jgi:hypothetical protein
LKGFQPFDITIRQDDGVAFVFSNIKLRDFMIEFGRYQRRRHKHTARIWAREPVDGKDKDLQLTREFLLQADGDGVNLEFEELDLPYPAPPRPPKPYQPEKPKKWHKDI